MQSMLKNPPTFAFNLCDEGFHNDALKELHVPAFLEMCQIDYSGSGPVGLAICYDKVRLFCLLSIHSKGLVNSTAAKLGIPTPRETYIVMSEAQDPKEVSLSELEHMVATRETNGEIVYPAFIKPMKVCIYIVVFKSYIRATTRWESRNAAFAIRAVNSSRISSRSLKNTACASLSYKNT
jgi:hypothetical protein